VSSLDDFHQTQRAEHDCGYRRGGQEPGVEKLS
jgi:hypothetical protein